MTQTRPQYLLLLAIVLTIAGAAAQASPSSVRWEERIEVAAGGGHRGPWRMNESEFHYVDDPTVAINDQGIVAVAWADHARKDIFLQIYGPNGTSRFRRPVNVSRSPRIFSWLPRLLITSGDTHEVSIVWQEIVFSGGSHGGEIFFSRSTDGGRTFSDPINLSKTTAGAGKGRLTRKYWDNGSLELAIGPEGQLYAAWTEYEGALRFTRSRVGGTTFSKPVQVAGSENVPARAPSLAAAADGTIYLAWTVGEDRAANIHFARSHDRGNSFQRPAVILQSKGHADAPKIAADTAGTVHLVYAESPMGPFERTHIRYASSDDGGRTFNRPRVISRMQADRWKSTGFPSIALGKNRNVYVIWELFPGRRGRPQGLGLTYSTDGGQSFAPASLVRSSADPESGFNGSQQGLLMRKLAVNRAGTIAIVNSTFKTNEGSWIHLFRGRGTGGSQSRSTFPGRVPGRGSEGGRDPFDESGAVSP